jgi:hypothetical protein
LHHNLRVTHGRLGQRNGNITAIYTLILMLLLDLHSRSQTMLKKFVLFAFISLIGACAAPAIVPPELPMKTVGSPIEIALTGIGSPRFSASVRQTGLRPQALGVEVSNRITLGDAIVRSSTDVVPLGQARTAGHRYLHVTLPITILEGAFTNLTFLAMNDLANNSPSAISQLSRYPGLAAYTPTEFAALSSSIEPTSPIMLEPFGQNIMLVPGEEDALQIYFENEIASLDNTLPYGFVAHNGTSRTISSTGTITIAMRVPLQAQAKDDPYTIKLRFGIYEDSQTIITESLQAQLTHNQARFQAARTRIGGELRVMPGTTKPNIQSRNGRAAPATSQTTQAICKVRTAGTGEMPTAFLVNRVPTFLIPKTNVIATGQTLPLEMTVSDPTGAFYLPAQVTLTDPKMVSAAGNQLTALKAGATTMNIDVCGLVSSSNLIVLDIFKPMAGGFWHSLAIKSDYTAAAWGSNFYGQTNVPVDYLIAVAGSFGNHNLALRTDGTVTAWGRNKYAQTDVPTGLTDVVAVAAGFEHSLSLKRNGTVVAWGGNNYLQADVPNDLANVVAISAGTGHTLALKSDGTLTTFGTLNQFGQTIIPVGLNNVIAIATGAYHNLALKRDGTVVAWGLNSVGQTTIPTGLSDVIAISAGANHSLALKSNGTVVAWGDSGNDESIVPSDLTDVVAIAAGGYHSLALKQDGSIVGWGLSGEGQITIPVITPLKFQVP